MSAEPGAAVHVLGVRHHGPGSARGVRSALEALVPDVVLIEGPPDADDVLRLAAHEGMKPPVALLVHAVDKPANAVFYPFAVFSPEWQAMQYALGRGVPVRFIDLPLMHQLDAESQAEEKAEPPREDALGGLARAAGHEDGEAWWEQLIEQRQDARDVFAAVQEAMTAVRETGGELPDRKSTRLNSSHSGESRMPSSA